MQGIEKFRQRWCGALRLQNRPYRKVLFSLAEFRVGLLERGADIDIKTDYGETALSAAASGGHEAVVKTLLKKGANLNLRKGTSKNPCGLL